MVVVASGGARAQSGPPKQPFSARSEAQGLELVNLPANGFKGYIPVFPLPRIETGDDAADVQVHKRELELWRRIWKYPQAAVWSVEKWRQDAVAVYVRTSVRVEGPDAKAADVNAMLRLREEIGLSPAGMARNGWVVAEDETSKKRAERSRNAAAEKRRRSFKVV